MSYDAPRAARAADVRQPRNAASRPRSFQELLQEQGFNGGAPISEQFFKERISGRHNPDIFAELFPRMSAAQHDALTDDKEARFRRRAATSLRPLPGLVELAAALTRRGVRVAAVTNAPRANVRARPVRCSAPSAR